MSETTEATEAKPKAGVKDLPASLYVCPRENVMEEAICSSIAVGRTLELAVYDCRTHKPLVGALLRRVTVTIKGKEDNMADHNYFIPNQPPDFMPGARANICRNAIKELESLKKIEPKKLNKKQRDTLKKHEKYLAGYRKVIEQRKKWVSYMQMGFKILEAYDGPINGQLDKEFGTIVKKYWAQWEKKKYDAKKAAKVLLSQLEGKKLTNRQGIVRIPLPANYEGKVQIEFNCIKTLDSTDAENALPNDPGSDKHKISHDKEADQRVDYDLVKAETDNPKHKHDLAGSMEKDSRWKYVIGSKSYNFQNYIEIKIEKPTEEDSKTPIRKWTLALVWCQPVWTKVHEDFIYDPLDPHYPDDPGPRLPREKSARGLKGRGLTPDGRPTLLACTKGTAIFSKYYGVWGNGGRKYENGVWKWHRGIDCAGKVDDPIFAPIGGEITGRRWFNNIAGRWLKLNPWISESPAFVQFLHINKEGYKVEMGDVVKAGDYIAVMGRSGDFPSESPTHTHFMWPSSVDTINVPEIFQTYGAAVPHNGLPKLLPCGAQYGNSVKCEFDHDTFAKESWVDGFCFAIAELACPKMPDVITVSNLGEPGSDKAKRLLQAQLRWIFYNNNSENKYLNPGMIDGKIGKRLPYVKITGTVNVRKWEPDQDPQPQKPPLLFKVKAADSEEFLLVDHKKVGNRYKVALSKEQVEKYKKQADENGQRLEQGQIILIWKDRCVLKSLGKTRKAIKKFNRENDPESNYEMSKPGLEKLNELAPLRPQRPSDSVPQQELQSPEAAEEGG